MNSDSSGLWVGVAVLVTALLLLPFLAVLSRVAS